jgi:hypothetical protein
MLKRLFLQSQHGAAVDRVAACWIGLISLNNRPRLSVAARQLSLSLDGNGARECYLKDNNLLKVLHASRGATNGCQMD